MLLLKCDLGSPFKARERNRQRQRDRCRHREALRDNNKKKERRRASGTWSRGKGENREREVIETMKGRKLYSATVDLRSKCKICLQLELTEKVKDSLYICMV